MEGSGSIGASPFLIKCIRRILRASTERFLINLEIDVCCEKELPIPFLIELTTINLSAMGIVGDIDRMEIFYVLNGLVTSLQSGWQQDWEGCLLLLSIFASCVNGKKWIRERVGSRRLVIIVLLACTTYTVQSTQEPDTHFSHLGLNTFGL